ncbi:MAG: hypothetical protein HQK66_02850 [Desulfamplus sp.]|nr:hypothetical protein [Desulfamplus sp.]
MKKLYQKIRLAVPIILLLLCIIFWPTVVDIETSATSSYESIIAHYNRIKQGEHSELKPFLEEVVRDRIFCYSSTSEYSLRLLNCRKEYIYRLLRTAREKIKSAPSLGKFILCIRDCPLSFSLCKGEEYLEATGIECEDMEILCIENCFDRYWRGSRLEE